MAGNRKGSKASGGRSPRVRTLGPSDLGIRRITVPSDPPQTTTGVRLMHRVRIPELIGTVILTPALIMGQVPGGATFWQSLQVHTVKVWGHTGGGTVEIGGAIDVLVTDPSGESWRLHDEGVFGSRRSKVGWELPLLTRAKWFGPADTTPLATINGEAVAHVTVMLQSIN